VAVRGVTAAGRDLVAEAPEGSGELVAHVPILVREQDAAVAHGRTALAGALAGTDIIVALGEHRTDDVRCSTTTRYDN